MSHEKKDEQYMGHLSKLEKDEKPVLTDSMACRFLYQCTEPPERERLCLDLQKKIVKRVTSDTVVYCSIFRLFVVNIVLL